MHTREPSFIRSQRLRAVALSVILTVTLALHGCTETETATPVADPLAAGPYPVGVTRVELYDAERDRVVLTEIWYPADESVRGLPPAAAGTYLPPGLEGLAANATIPLVAVRDVPLAPGGPFPLVEFSHGNGGIRFQNTFQMEHLASHGYIVAAPDHFGNTFFSNVGTQAEHAMNRPLDMSFVADELTRLSADPDSEFYDWVDARKGFGVTGHSFGAFTSLATASTDPRFVAALPMALGGPVGDDYAAATLLLLATEDKTIGLGGNQGVRDTYALLGPPRYLGEIVDAGHYSFSFACQTGLGIGDGDGCKTSTRFADASPFTFVDDMRVWDIVNGYSAALFGRYINGITDYDEILNQNIDPEVLLYTADPIPQ